MNNKEIIVALVGNPNSGKTSLFNQLAGESQKVGNWAGVTVEKYEGSVKHNGYLIKIIDLPGTYSLSAYSPEEIITRDFIIKEHPDVIVDVVDGSNLERNLYLTTQLMELQTDMLIAINMYDEIEKQGTLIDIKHLQTLLGTHIIPTSAVRKTGIKSLLDHIIRIYLKDISIPKHKLSYRDAIEEKITRISDLLSTHQKEFEGYSIRWLALKLLESDKIVYQLIKDLPVWIRIEPILQEAIKEFAGEYNADSEMAIIEDRDSFIKGAIHQTVVNNIKIKKTVTDYLDAILINRIVGLPIFFSIMWLAFQFTFRLGEAPMHWIQKGFDVLAVIGQQYIPNQLAKSVIVDGIIAGVGGVLIFIPNIILLFIALAFLEGTGYMARAAFVVDKIMHKVGLHGKSFIPMITGFGCSVPAIMATRTIKNRGDRLVTMMIIPFMSCGAKLPVYVLLTGAFFPSYMAGNIIFALYLLGIIIALISAKLLKTALFNKESEPFVMELPPYRMPTMSLILNQARIKTFLYIKKAGTLILAASLVIWFLSNFPQDKSASSEYEKLKSSFAGRIGHLIEPVISPLGFDWQTGIALISGLAAKELVVSTMATMYSLGDTTESVDLADTLNKNAGFSTASALSLMTFVLLYIPCMATIAVFRKEAGSWKWVGIYAAYAIVVAWIVAFFVYRLFSFLIPLWS